MKLCSYKSFGLPRRTAWLIFVWAVLGIVAGSNVKADPVSDTASDVLVIVNGDTITTHDLSALLVNFHTSMNRADKLDFDYRKLLNKLVNDRLIIQEATALGIESEPAIVEQVDSLRNRRAVSMYLTEHYKPDLTIGEDSIRSYFDRYYSRLQVRTVSVATEKEAEAVANDIRGGMPMDSLARDKSLDIYRYQGGLHHFKYYGDVENVIRDAARGLKPGEVSSPFRFREVWAVLRVEQIVRQPARLE